ncbi:co-chaperone GroES, partial [Shimia thalassica]|nr:co-chaperone GroES [Shimia thalassica]
IPDIAKEHLDEGSVVSVVAGPRDDIGSRVELDVKAGDRVLFGKCSGTEVSDDGEEQ